MSQPTRFGILSFAHYHANFWAEAINNSDEATLAGVWDDDATRGQAAADQYGSRYWSNLDDLLADHVQVIEAELAAQRRGLADCIDRLDERAWRILALRYGDDLPSNQIAEKLNMAPGSIRGALHRIRRSLLDDATRDAACGLKAVRRDIYLALPFFDNNHRFLPALVQRDGGKVASVAVNHRPRLRGRSKYGVGNRLWVGIVDLFGVYWLHKRQL